MRRTEELLKLCAAAEQQRDYIRISMIKPKVLKELVELVRLQHDALEAKAHWVADKRIHEAIERFDLFER